MALDFKTMSLEKKIVVCASLAIAVFGLVALIVSFSVYGSLAAMIKGEAAKAFVAAFSDGKVSNPLGGYNWIVALSFFAFLGVACISYFKTPESKLAPAVPFKLIIPCVVVLAGLFAWFYLSIGMNKDENFTGFLMGNGKFLGVVTLLLFLCYTALFGFFAFEKKDDLMKALPYCLLAVGGLFLLIATIKCLAYSGAAEAFFNATKDSIPSPLGLLKTAWIINSLCLIGYGCLTFLKAKDED